MRSPYQPLALSNGFASLLVFRLTPVYALILMVSIGVFPYLKEGPFQNKLGMESETTCRDYWYFNLLYVNNFVDMDKLVRLPSRK